MADRALIPWCIAMSAMLAASAVPAQAPASPSEYLRQLDSDGDGRVSAAEYRHWMTRGFRAMDRNGDGVLEAHELPAGVTLRAGQARLLAGYEASLDAAFKRQDRNGDGFLDAAELAAPPR
jgi:Ca2+-binding EF-hand superfamily protein